MPRLPRIQLEGAIYYVTSKGSEDQAVFKDKADFMMYLDLLTKYKKQHAFKLFAYCLSPDKLELLIETGENATISEIMHDLNSLYTKYYNGRYQRKGHLFESRFRSVLIEKAKHLASMTRQIHWTPAKLDPAGSVADHPFTSFGRYAGHSGANAPDLAAEVAEVVEFLKKKDNGVSYERYCLDAKPEEIDEIEKSLRRGSIFGSEVFTAAVKNRVQEISESQKEAEGAPARKGLVFMAGGAVLVVSALSIYLYIGKVKVENRYEELLSQKNAEFEEKTRFENRNPLSLEDLKGTEWKIDLVSQGDASPAIVNDAIHFSAGGFSSDHFSSQGFKPAAYSITARGNGVSVWKAELKNAGGDTLGWRGTWQGDAMKGLVSLQPAGQKTSRDFSFFSVEWKKVRS